MTVILGDLYKKKTVLLLSFQFLCVIQLQIFWLGSNQCTKPSSSALLPFGAEAFHPYCFCLNFYSDSNHPEKLLLTHNEVLEFLSKDTDHPLVSSEALPPLVYRGVEASPWQAEIFSRYSTVSPLKRKCCFMVGRLTIALYTFELKVTHSHKSL